jgi:hypothetical protein
MVQAGNARVCASPAVALAGWCYWIVDPRLVDRLIVGGLRGTPSSSISSASAGVADSLLHTRSCHARQTVADNPQQISPHLPQRLYLHHGACSTL